MASTKYTIKIFILSGLPSVLSVWRCLLNFELGAHRLLGKKLSTPKRVFTYHSTTWKWKLVMLCHLIRNQKLKDKYSCNHSRIKKKGNPLLHPLTLGTTLPVLLQNKSDFLGCVSRERTYLSSTQRQGQYRQLYNNFCLWESSCIHLFISLEK